MENLEVGMRVQGYTKCTFGEVKDGTVLELIPGITPTPKLLYLLPEEERNQYINFAKVLWDDGTEELIQQWSLSKPDSAVEREFRVAMTAAKKLIYSHIDDAAAALQKAVDISEETGIPFGTQISFLSQCYTPHSMLEKFPQLNTKSIQNITDDASDYSGWQHSAVCY